MGTETDAQLCRFGFEPSMLFLIDRANNAFGRHVSLSVEVESRLGVFDTTDADTQQVDLDTLQ